MEQAQGWAQEEFGHARLGDRRRTKRLVAMATRVAERPGGQVTYVFRDSATREGAFKLVENDAVDIRAVARASHEACARRGQGLKYVFVPVDGSSLNITDDDRTKGTGVVGARRVGARGFQVMTALAVAPDGTPLGVCGQTFWSRVERTKRKARGRDSRPTKDKETARWLEVMSQVREAFSGTGPLPWFQGDRGGDAWPVLLDGLEPGQLFTIRATHDRRLQLDSPDAERRYLWAALEERPVMGSHFLDLPASGGRRARRATIEIRAREVTIDFRVGSKRRVFASIPRRCSNRAFRLLAAMEWTGWLVSSSHSTGFSRRIEEFHRLWTSGACHVEDTQLRDRDHIIRWATILAAVAVRASFA